MGKQSRRKRERDPGEAAATRYLRRMGLPARPEGGAYRRLAAADPDWFRRVGEADDARVALAGTPGADPDRLQEATRAAYALLYRDLDTALAEYASGPVAVAHAWLRWWTRHHPPATRLVDVGCGAGVLTCAYALALPRAEVVGVDVTPEAVACAEELARRVGAGNAAFVVADYTAPWPPPGTGPFDQLVAVAALGDGGVFPQRRGGEAPGFSSVAEVDGPGQAFRSPALATLAGHLCPGGRFLAFERTPEAPQALWLGAALIHAGVDVDLTLAGVDPTVETGRDTAFTRFVGTRTDTPGATPADVARWVKTANPAAYGRAWRDEVRFAELKAAGAELVWAAEIDYSPYEPLLERREIWAGADGAFGWVSTSQGLRELSPFRPVDELVAEYRAYTRKWAASGLQVHRYRG